MNKEQIKEFEKEYNTWLSTFKGEKNYAEKYYMAYMGAIRLKPSVINFSIHDQEKYQELSEKFSSLSRLKRYREYAERKREEEQYDFSVFEKEEEIDVSKIPF